MLAITRCQPKISQYLNTWLKALCNLNVFSDKADVKKTVRPPGAAAVQYVVVIPHRNILVAIGVCLRPKRCQVISAGEDVRDGAVGLTWVSVLVDSDNMIGNLSVTLLIDGVQEDEEQVKTGEKGILTK